MLLKDPFCRLIPPVVAADIHPSIGQILLAGAGNDAIHVSATADSDCAKSLAMADVDDYSHAQQNRKKFTLNIFEQGYFH